MVKERYFLGPPEVETEIVGEREWKELSLFSTLIFTMSVLLVQVMVTLITAVSLGFFSISFIYSLFEISYPLVGSESAWDEGRIIIVYTIAPVMCFLVGLILLRLHPGNWKNRLILTWFSLALISYLPCSMLAGIFFYDGIGIALNWLFPSLVVRVSIGLISVAALVLSKPFWINRFARTVYSVSFLSEPEILDKYFKKVMILPWFKGSVILLVFALSQCNGFWLTTATGLGLLILPVFFRRIPIPKFSIHKNDKKIFHSPGSSLFIGMVLLALYLISFIRVGF